MIDEYIKNGYTILNCPFDQTYIINLKKEINSLFKNENETSISINSLTNNEVFYKIINILNTSEIQNFTQELSNHFNTKVSLLPNFHIMRNYHVNRLSVNRIGWHRDVASELNYEYCKNKINNDKYVFGKVGIFLQENSENYGGAVDVIPASHHNVKKKKILRFFSSLRLHFLVLLQKKLLSIYKLLPERFYLTFLSAKKTQAKPGEPIFFDSRIQHRGSPIKDEFLFNTKKLGKMHLLVPENYTKISIYAYFGSTDGADSYIYARTKRPSEGYKKYFSGWIKEIDQYKNYESLYDSMKTVVNPLIKKYKDN